jgi:hypothetical protein
LHIRGDHNTARVYDGSISLTTSGTAANPITIQPHADERVELRAPTGARILYLIGDHIVIDGKGQLVLDKANEWGQVLRINGDHNTLRNLEAKNAQWIGTMVLLEGNGNLIDNVVIHDCYNGDSQDCVAVRIDGGNDNVIQNSTIYDIRGDCINIDDRALTEQGTIINANHLYTTLGSCSENAIDIKFNRADGRALQITNNVMHGFRACPSTCGGSGDPHGEAVSVHNSCDNVQIIGNTIFDSTTAIGLDDYISNATVRDNVIYDLATDDPHASAIHGAFFIRARNVDIAGNSVEDTPQSFAFVSPLSEVHIHHNTFTRAGTISDEGLSGWTADYNCWLDSKETLPGPHDACPPPVERLTWLEAIQQWLQAPTGAPWSNHNANY